MPQQVNSLIAGWRIQLRNVKSLMLRDMVMRNGRENIGFGWVLLEPMILTAGVMVVWTVASGGTTGKEGLNVVEIVLTGYMPLTLWRHMTSPSNGLFARSVPLLYHRRITPFDILISKLALEFVGTSAAFAFVWGALYLMGLVSPIADLGLLLVGWSMMGLLGLSAGAILSTVTERWEASERFIQPTQYLMVPISGCFFIADWLPPTARDWVLLNPMVHSFEALRAGYFGAEMTFHYDLGYFFAWALVLLFAGVLCVKGIRRWIRIN